MMAGSTAPSTHLGGRTLVVNSNTKHPAEAWKLTQFLTKANLFEKYYVNQMPAQKSLLAQIAYPPEEIGFSEQQLIKHSQNMGCLCRQWCWYRANVESDIKGLWRCSFRADNAT